jgi:tetratricopeptide (TPR) repeat protein
MQTTQDPEPPEHQNTTEYKGQTQETPPLPSISVNQRVEKNVGGTNIGVYINQPRPLRIPLQRPAQVENFTGREDELQQLLEALQPGKVVTLCGPGGMGKTALASRAVWTLAPGEHPPERFPDGILFHTFYNRPEVAILFEKIAAEFGEDLRPSPHDAAQRALAGRRLLLILDGAEQADDLRSILAIHDFSSVLITTRSRKDAPALRIDLDPLPPDSSAALLKALGGEYAAEDDAVRKICALVGDLPLAICLAGRYLSRSEDTAGQYLVWLKSMPLEALDQGERRDRSVRILLERSLGEISELARRVIAVCGVLAYSPVDPQSIAAALDQPPKALKPVLNELVNSGLLRRQENRYQLGHPLIQTYARQLLQLSGDELSRLGAFYLKLSVAFGVEHQLFFLLDAELPHIINVLLACQERQDWQDIILLVRSVYYYMDLGGHSTQWLTVLNFGLSAARNLSDYISEAQFLGDLGNANRHLGQMETAIEYHQQALAIVCKIGDRRGECKDLGNLGNAYSNLGQVERAIEFYEEALAIMREIGDRRGEGNQLGNLGSAYFSLEQVERAVEFYEQALAIAGEIGDRRGEGLWLGNLGNAYRHLGQVERAIEFYEQALAIAGEIGDRRSEANHYWNLGLAYQKLDDLPSAISVMQACVGIEKELRDPDVEADAAKVAELRAKLDQ